jgi:hypothetical protein
MITEEATKADDIELMKDIGWLIVRDERQV